MTKLVEIMKDTLANTFCLPLDVSIIIDNEAAIKFVKTFRSSPYLNCPRCRSRFTKHINSRIFSDISRCIDCGYIFNSLAGTVFQGTKLPIIKIIQAAVILDSQADQINLRDVGYVLDVSYKTALGIQRKIGNYRYGVEYVRKDGDYSFFNIHAQSKGQKFAHYCAIHKLRIEKELFFKRMHTMLDIAKNEESVF